MFYVEQEYFKNRIHCPHIMTYNQHMIDAFSIESLFITDTNNLNKKIK